MPLTWTQETGEGEGQRVVGGVCLGDKRSRCMWGGWSWNWIQDLESTWDVAVGELWTK